MPRFRSKVVTTLVSTLVLTAVATGPALAQYRGFGQNKVQYRDLEWMIYHSPHFDVYYDKASEALLNKVVSFAESAYDQLSREFDFQIQKPTPLIFYPTHSAFEQNNIILNFIPEGAGAFASPVRNRMVLPVDMPDPELLKLILHELTHIFQYNILYQGSLSRAAAARPPQWFMEGMASYMAKDEESHDRMVLRDYVVNDAIPSVAGGDAAGYFAYRFGHAVFDYIEERWGREGFLDFVYEFRNTLGARTERAIERAFRLTSEDFDTDFRRWLRKKYLRQLVETGEPSDFGRPFRVDDELRTQETSAVASPSGDLVAAFSVLRGDLDIVLFESKTRRLVRNLTEGLTTRYRYLVVQGMTVARRVGRDLAFSPDGNYLAAFARRDGGRSLLIFDVLRGGISRAIDMDVEQQFSLSWSPDGKKIAFAGNREGDFDIYLIDLDTEQVEQITKDPIYDGGPAFSPDGRSLVFTSVVGDFSKLFRIDLADPSQRYALTTGESNDKDAIYSPDGRRIYFTSDRAGVDNIYSLDPATGDLKQYTNVVTGCFTPAVVPRPEGPETLVYAGLWQGAYKLYLTDLDQVPPSLEKVEIAQTPAAAAELPIFQPSIEVTLDEANKEKYGRGKFFITDADTYLGVDDSQTLLGRVFVGFSDYLGDKRILLNLSSFDALSNFDITYLDLSDRTQWGANLFDDRDFYFVTTDPFTGQLLDRRGEIRLTGAYGFIRYPFGLSTRAEVGLGYLFRKYFRTVPVFAEEEEPGGTTPPVVVGFELETIKDDYPFLQAALVHDSTIYASWGPIAGSRWRIDGLYGPDLSTGESISSEVSADYRRYQPVTTRSGLAMRAFAGARYGDTSTPFRLGGDNIRTVRYRSLPGDRAFFANLEYRFPLIEVVATPVFAFRGIRGRLFFDVGAVWFDELGALRRDEQGQAFYAPFDFWDSDENRLEDGIAVYGWGFTVNFVGLDLNWDFGQRWDGKSSIGDTITTFYIGTQF